MQARDTDDMPAYAPVLEPGLIARLQALNRDYLELIAAKYNAGGQPTHALPLPIRIAESIARLDAKQRHALACTAYSLYSLGFDNVTFWRTVSASGSDLPAPARYGAEIDGARDVFCEIALFAAWHSAVANPVAARVLYGMSDVVLESLCATPLWLVKRIAADHPRLLAPRWPLNRRFWPDLVRFAAQGDARRLATAQLLGNQLLAVELERARRRGAGLGARGMGQRRASANPANT